MQKSEKLVAGVSARHFRREVAEELRQMRSQPVLDSENTDDENVIQEMLHEGQELHFEVDYNASSPHTEVKDEGRSDTVSNGCKNCEMLVTMMKNQKQEISALQKAVAKQTVMINRLCKFFFPEERTSTSLMPFKFPLQEDQELQNLEEFLVSNANQEILKQWILRAKGPKELKSFFKNFIHFSVQSQYNVRGVRGKRKFSNFERICACLFECFKKDGYGQQQFMADLEKALRDGKVRFNKRKQQNK